MKYKKIFRMNGTYELILKDETKQTKKNSEFNAKKIQMNVITRQRYMH